MMFSTTTLAAIEHCGGFPRARELEKWNCSYFAQFLRFAAASFYGTAASSKAWAARKRVSPPPRETASELESQRRFLHAILNSIGDAIFVKDRKHRCI
jgi:hypothetical protein